MVNVLLQIWSRLLSLLRRGRYERETEEEMRFHLEMQIEQNLASGMAEEEAHYAARRQFGNRTWLKVATIFSQMSEPILRHRSPPQAPQSAEEAQRKYQEAFLLFLSAESPRSPRLRR